MSEVKGLISVGCTPEQEIDVMERIEAGEFDDVYAEIDDPVQVDMAAADSTIQDLISIGCTLEQATDVMGRIEAGEFADEDDDFDPYDDGFCHGPCSICDHSRRRY